MDFYQRTAYMSINDEYFDEAAEQVGVTYDTLNVCEHFSDANTLLSYIHAYIYVYTMYMDLDVCINTCIYVYVYVFQCRLNILVLRYCNWGRHLTETYLCMHMYTCGMYMKSSTGIG